MSSLAHAQTMGAYNRWIHRGQLTTLVKQAGRDPGGTDLIGLPDLESVSEARSA